MAEEKAREEILLHACCGPCSTYSVSRLRELGLTPTGYWWNPNIHPFMEHERRRQSLGDLAQKMRLPLIEGKGYEMVEFLRRVTGKEGDRCGDCYLFRLGQAAQAAKEAGFRAFTTTLLISPYQRHGLLKEVGQQAGREHGVEFFYEDLRKGFGESRRMTKELGLYRQQYCGCIYSEWERYGGVKLGEGFRWA
ncbi:MAG: epoxyqueuosine reductase QueH [Chloroflexi bacterium]|nr:epoxyqueuosine reductase QueH [Chloroflexota bacterium]